MRLFHTLPILVPFVLALLSRNQNRVAFLTYLLFSQYRSDRSSAGLDEDWPSGLNDTESQIKAPSFEDMILFES